MRAQLLLFHWGLLAAGLLAASLWDIRSRRIPNWLNVGILCSGLLARWLTTDVVCAGWGLAGAAVGLLLLLYPFARGWIGAGDVKLLAACGGWLGPLSIISAALFGSAAGGAVAMVYYFRAPKDVKKDIGSNLKLAALARRIPQAEDRPPTQSPPYAVAIALGTVAVIVLEEVFKFQLVRW